MFPRMSESGSSAHCVGPCPCCWSTLQRQPLSFQVVLRQLGNRGCAWTFHSLLSGSGQHQHCDVCAATALFQSECSGQSRTFACSWIGSWSFCQLSRCLCLPHVQSQQSCSDHRYHQSLLTPECMRSQPALQWMSRRTRSYRCGCLWTSRRKHSSYVAQWWWARSEWHSAVLEHWRTLVGEGCWETLLAWSSSKSACGGCQSIITLEVSKSIQSIITWQNTVISSLEFKQQSSRYQTVLVERKTHHLTAFRGVNWDGDLPILMFVWGRSRLEARR